MNIHTRNTLHVIYTEPETKVLFIKKFTDIWKKHISINCYPGISFYP